MAGMTEPQVASEMQARVLAEQYIRAELRQDATVSIALQLPKPPRVGETINLAWNTIESKPYRVTAIRALFYDPPREVEVGPNEWMLVSGEYEIDLGPLPEA